MQTAGSMRQALGALHWAHPSLILLDLHLPNANGLDLLELIRTHPTAGASPVICMSGRDDDRAVSAAYAASANGLMVKSADYDAFFDGVCRTLRYWLGANRLPRDCGEKRAYA